MIMNIVKEYENTFLVSMKESLNGLPYLRHIPKDQYREYVKYGDKNMKDANN